MLNVQYAIGYTCFTSDGAPWGGTEGFPRIMFLVIASYSYKQDNCPSLKV